MTTITAQRLGTALAPSPALRGAALSAGAIIALASAEGGVFPSSWRVGAVALGALACVHALWAPVRRTPTTIPLFAPLVALGLLSVASAAWSASPSASLLDAQRTLLYVAALASFALAGEGLVAGVAVGAGTIGVWALATRLVDGTTIDRYEGRLLTGPIGYANGWATVSLQPAQFFPRKGYLVLFVRARVEGQDLLAGTSTRRLVQVTIAPPRS